MTFDYNGTEAIERQRGKRESGRWSFRKSFYDWYSLKRFQLARSKGRGVNQTHYSRYVECLTYDRQARMAIRCLMRRDLNTRPTPESELRRCSLEAGRIL